jgi:hypothetical protein
LRAARREHTIRDERDFERHVDYIRFNPVKHGLVARVRDWPYSSFHRYVRRGLLAAPEILCKIGEVSASGETNPGLRWCSIRATVAGRQCTHQPPGQDAADGSEAQTIWTQLTGDRVGDLIFRWRYIQATLRTRGERNGISNALANWRTARRRH